MKFTKVYDSVNENNGLEYTVGVKSLGLLSTTIDKALGGMLRGGASQVLSRVCEGATIDSTLVQVAEKHDEKAISAKTTTEKAESENVVAKSVSAQQVLTKKVVVEKAEEKNVVITKSTVANVAVEEVAAKTNSSAKAITAKQVDLSVLSKSLRTEEGTSQHGVDVNAQPEVLEQLSQDSVSETQRFISLQVVEAGGQQEIQKSVSTERFSEDRRVTSQTKLMSSSSSNLKCPMQRTLGNLVRSLE